MKLRPAVVYTTGHALNERISRILAQGFSAQKRPASLKTLRDGEVTFLPVAPEPDATAIVYGILRGTGEILRECERARFDYLYCDHSYFDASRSDTSRWQGNDIPGYFRLVPNDRYFRHLGDMPSDRWQELGIELKPWRKQSYDGYILLVPLSKFVAAYRGVDANAWLRETVTRIRKYTRRKILMKPKDTETPLDAALQGAHALVTLESNSAVEAAINGVPVFTSVSAAAAPMASQNIALIDNPPIFDREQHLYNLAYQQFTAVELGDGTARKILESQMTAPAGADSFQTSVPSGDATAGAVAR